MLFEFNNSIGFDFFKFRSHDKYWTVQFGTDENFLSKL